MWHATMQWENAIRNVLHATLSVLQVYIHLHVVHTEQVTCNTPRGESCTVLYIDFCEAYHSNSAT